MSGFSILIIHLMATLSKSCVSMTRANLSIPGRTVSLKNLSKRCLVNEMVFYVYMSPDVISDANSGGRYAMQTLIGILHGFMQNCFIAEFEDNRMQKKVFGHVNEMPFSDAK